jgi:hypothetical protein
MFSPAEIKELKNKLGLNNPARLFGKDFYKWMNLDKNGLTPYVELRRILVPESIVAGSTTAVTYETVLSDASDLYNELTGDIIVKDKGVYQVQVTQIWEIAITTRGTRGIVIQSTGGHLYADHAVDITRRNVVTTTGMGFVDSGEEITVSAFNDDSAAKTVSSRVTIVRVG